MIKEPLVYVWDIETGFNIAAIFELFPRNGISHKSIMSEKYVISAAFKELGKGKTFAYSIADNKAAFADDPTNDYYIMEKIYETLSEADALVAHYGDRYDIKFVNTRLLYHGFPPLPPIITVDTYKIAKNHFLFNSNRLDYLGEYLGLGNKIHTDHTLWMRCLHGERAAVAEMVRYNKQDVDLLERVYQVLAPWAPAKVNRALFTQQEVCPLCGSPNITYQGWRYTQTRAYQRILCGDCGHWGQLARCVENSTATTK